MIDVKRECDKCTCGECGVKRNKCDTGCRNCYLFAKAETEIKPCFSGIWNGEQYHEGKAIERKPPLKSPNTEGPRLGGMPNADRLTLEELEAEQ